MNKDLNKTEIQVNREGELAIITLNGPETRNALDAQARIALLANVHSVMRESRVRAVILTGAAGHFCAGSDVSQATHNTIQRGRRHLTEFGDIARELLGGCKPVVSAVEGIAYEAGLSLAVACDLVVTARDARFCPVLARTDLVPDTAALWTLVRKVGSARARQLLALAREFDGQEALELGVASHLTEPGNTLEMAKDIALRMATKSPMAVAMTKAALTFRCATFGDSLQAEVDYQPLLGCSVEPHPKVQASSTWRDSQSLGAQA